MRRASSLRSAAVLLVGIGGGCALVSDLDHELGESREGVGGASSSASGAEGGGEPSTSGSTSSTAAGDGGGVSSTATGTGGDPGVGGGGGAACSFEGEGPGDGPWSLVLGPIPRTGPTPSLDLDMDDERVMLGLVAGAGADPEPLLLDGATVTPGTEARYVIGWVDDGGASRAWPLTGAVPEAPAAGIAVELIDHASALVAVTGSDDGGSGPGTRALVLPVDLCEATEQPPILDCAVGVSDVAIDADADGRLAIALSVVAGVTCRVLPGDCMLPAGIGAEDTVLFHVGPGGSCASTLIREDDEGTGYPYSVQNGASVALADDGAVVVVGVYDGDLFAGGAAIATGLPHYLEGDPPYVAERFHRYLARFEVDGSTLRVDDAVDLGIIAFAVGGHDVKWRDGAAVVVGGAYIASQPTGPFDVPVSLSGAGYLDVLAGVFPTPAAPVGLDWHGGNSVDVPWRVSSMAAGMMVAGWSTSIEETFAACDDPIVIGDQGAPVGGGCAFFVPLGDDAAPGVPLVVDAAATEELDVGLGAFALPGGDAMVVGVTSGEVELDRALPAPPKNFVDVYVARRP